LIRPKVKPTSAQKYNQPFAGSSVPNGTNAMELVIEEAGRYAVVIITGATSCAGSLSTAVVTKANQVLATYPVMSGSVSVPTCNGPTAATATLPAAPAMMQIQGDVHAVKSIDPDSHYDGQYLGAVVLKVRDGPLLYIRRGDLRLLDHDELGFCYTVSAGRQEETVACGSIGWSRGPNITHPTTVQSWSPPSWMSRRPESRSRQDHRTRHLPLRI
jgi:hypothetical protein